MSLQKTREKKTNVIIGVMGAILGIVIGAIGVLHIVNLEVVSDYEKVDIERQLLNQCVRKGIDLNFEVTHSEGEIMFTDNSRNFSQPFSRLTSMNDVINSCSGYALVDACAGTGCETSNASSQGNSTPLYFKLQMSDRVQ